MTAFCDLRGIGRLFAKLRSNFVQRLDYLGDILIRHAWIDRQRNAPVKIFFRVREVTRAVSPLLAVIAVEVQWNEVDCGSDSTLAKFFNDLVAVNTKFGGIDQDHIEVP